MNQYFDEKTNKYHITMEVGMPRRSSSRKNNFRIYSITNDSNEIIKDPVLSDSKYVFEIHNHLFGRKVFFKFSFEKNMFEKIKSFNFGLCEEGYGWIFKDIIVENNFFIDKNLIESPEDKALDEVTNSEGVADDVIVGDVVDNSFVVVDKTDIIKDNESIILLVSSQEEALKKQETPNETISIDLIKPKTNNKKTNSKKSNKTKIR